MTQHAAKLFITSLFLGIAFDFLFWRQYVGLNFALFTLLCVAGGFFFLLTSAKKPNWKSLWLILPFAFFSMLSFWRQEPLTLFLSYLFTLFSMGLLAVTFSGGRWMHYSLFDHLFKFARLVFEGLLFGPIIFLYQVYKDRVERGVKFKLPILPVVRGLLLALPVLLVFAMLLASADLVFSQRLSDFFEMFKTENLGEYVFRLTFILFYFYATAGTFLYTALKSADEKLAGEEKPVVQPFIGFTESSIVLGSVVFLFLAFVIIQLQYFFGGDVNIGVEGYTYSQYARRGFNELVIVAFFSLALILGLNVVARRETNLQRNIYSGLGIALALLVMVILASAFQRLALAIDWHGFSRLRLYPRVFLIWVGLLFLAVVVLEVLRRERYFAFAALLAATGFAVSLCLLNVDAEIVRHNVFRAAQGRHFNVAYLASLSLDAVPALADEFRNTALSQTVHEGIGAALVCQRHSPAMQETLGDWRSFNYSRWAATNALDGLKAELASYRANPEKNPRRVKTPGNVLYECIGLEPIRED